MKIIETVEEANVTTSKRTSWRAEDMAADYRREQDSGEWFPGGKQFGAGPMKADHLFLETTRTGRSWNSTKTRETTS